MRRTCRCISARWTARSRPSFARTGATSARATFTPSTHPITAARTCPTSPSARRCSTDGKILFWVASRGHHADVGGISPGSMSPNATTIEQEGVYIDNFKLVDRGRFREGQLYALLTGAKYPARNPAAERQRPEGADRRQREGRAGAAQDGARISAAGGPRLYAARAGQCGRKRAPRHRPAARQRVRRRDGSGHRRSTCASAVDKKKREATVDFTGTSPQQPNNFNAPEPVTRAAVLYVFRVMVDDDIPMNAGCLRPIRIVIPEEIDAVAANFRPPWSPAMSRLRRR